MNNYWLGKKNKSSQFECCSVVSDIILFNGRKGITQDSIDQKWNYDGYPPSVSTVYNLVKYKHIKWYIRNHIIVEDKIWNGDFIHGLSTCGRIKWQKKIFPSFLWTSNDWMMDILKESPFYGKITAYKNEASMSALYKWCDVPALYLPYGEKSISFMAGVLATGKTMEKNGEMYANYSKLALPYIVKFGIPIEYSSPNNIYNLVSPIWPAILTDYMPSSCKKWLDIKHGGYKSEMYAPILWRMYVSNDIQRGGIPYLNSRRWVYNHFGTIEDTEQQWLKLGLSQLDNRFRVAIRSSLKNV